MRRFVIVCFSWKWSLVLKYNVFLPNFSSFFNNFFQSQCCQYACSHAPYVHIKIEIVCAEMPNSPQPDGDLGWGWWGLVSPVPSRRSFSAISPETFGSSLGTYLQRVFGLSLLIEINKITTKTWPCSSSRGAQNEILFARISELKKLTRTPLEIGVRVPSRFFLLISDRLMELTIRNFQYLSGH